MDPAASICLYKDVNSAYTPLVMYYFGLFFKYRISIDYEYLVIGQVVIELISACAFYLISLKLLNIRKLSVLCSLIFLNLIYYNEGYHIMLEPLVIFFTLSSRVFPNSKSTMTTFSIINFLYETVISAYWSVNF